MFKSLERLDLSYPPIISALNTLGPAADFLAPGDRLHQIDSISTIGLTNNHVLNLLLSGDQPAVVEIEYCLPEYSKSSLTENHKNDKKKINVIFFFIHFSFTK